MSPLVLLYLFLAPETLISAEAQQTLQQVAQSGQVAVLGETPSERVAPPRLIAPGPPPLLSFRLLEGKVRHRFGDLDLVLDDAGH